MSDEKIITAGSGDAPSKPPKALRGLRNRLKIKSPMVRKIAIIDLVKLHESVHTTDVPHALAEHLQQEAHPPLQLRLISFLMHTRYTPAIEVMEQLAAREDTDEAVKAALADAIDKLRP